MEGYLAVADEEEELFLVGDALSGDGLGQDLVAELDVVLLQEVHEAFLTLLDDAAALMPER